MRAAATTAVVAFMFLKTPTNNKQKRDRLRVEPSEMAVLMSEPAHSTRASREKAVEVLFESLRPPAAFLARDAVLASFAMGRQSSLVIDMGHRSTTGALRCL